MVSDAAGPSRHLIPSMQRATHRVALHLAQSLSQHALGQAEAHVLVYLGGVGRGAMNDLHRDFGHRRSTLTSIVDRLVARGLLVREQNPDDGRSFVVALTPDGASVAAAVHQAFATLLRAVVERTTPEDRRGFAAVVAAIGEVTA